MQNPEGTVAAGVSDEFRPVAIAERVTSSRNPSAVLIDLKDLAIAFADEEKSPLPPEIAAQALQLFDSASKELHGPIAHVNDFETAWAFGRFLHRLDKNKDALGWVNHALSIDEDHPKAAKAMGRRIEILMDLHPEVPGRGYDAQAFSEAAQLASTEKSDYAKELLASARDLVYERRAVAGEIVYGDLSNWNPDKAVA